MRHLDEFRTGQEILKLRFMGSDSIMGSLDWMLTTKGKYESMAQVGQE